MKKNLKKKKINLIKIEISFTERYKNVNSNFYNIVFFLKKYNYNLISISKIKYKNGTVINPPPIPNNPATNPTGIAVKAINRTI